MTDKKYEDRAYWGIIENDITAYMVDTSEYNEEKKQIEKVEKELHLTF